MWNSNFFASLHRDLTNRIYIFAAIIFVAELSGDPSTPVSVFELQVEGFTLGILQAGAFCVVLQTMLSLIFSLWMMNQSEFAEQVDQEIKNIAKGQQMLSNPVYSRVREAVSRSEKGAVLVYNLFHIALPAIVGIGALMWSFPDLCGTLSDFPGAVWRLCEK